MDIQLQRDQIEGMIARGKELREQEQRFLKASGLAESIEKARIEAVSIEETLEDIKDELKEKVAEKNAGVAKTTDAIAEKMSDILPEGKALLSVENGLSISWDETPYAGLSGSQKVTFDGAIVHALGCDIIVMEAAEVDSESLPAMLDKLKDIEEQVFISTCHSTEEIPEGFQVVEVGE